MRVRATKTVEYEIRAHEQLAYDPDDGTGAGCFDGCRDCGEPSLGPGDKCLRCYHEDMAVAEERGRKAEDFMESLSSQRERGKQGPR